MFEAISAITPVRARPAPADPLAADDAGFGRFLLGQSEDDAVGDGAAEIVLGIQTPNALLGSLLPAPDTDGALASETALAGAGSDVAGQSTPRMDPSDIAATETAPVMGTALASDRGRDPVLPDRPYRSDGAAAARQGEPAQTAPRLDDVLPKPASMPISTKDLAQAIPPDQVHLTAQQGAAALSQRMLAVRPSSGASSPDPSGRLVRTEREPATRPTSRAGDAFTFVAGSGETDGSLRPVPNLAALPAKFFGPSTTAPPASLAPPGDLQATVPEQDGPSNTAHPVRPIGSALPDAAMPFAVQGAATDPEPDMATAHNGLPAIQTASTAPPVGPAGTLIPAPPAHLAPDLVRLLSSPPDGTVTLTLRPEELGTLHFQMSQAGDEMRIYLTVDQPSTLDLLRRHTDQLLAELRQAGFGNATLSFNGGDRQEGPPQEQPSARGQVDEPTPGYPVNQPSRTPTGALDLRL